jgi:hypothetical protein
MASRKFTADWAPRHVRSDPNPGRAVYPQMRCIADTRFPWGDGASISFLAGDVLSQTSDGYWMAKRHPNFVALPDSPKEKRP